MNTQTPDLKHTVVNGTFWFFIAAIIVNSTQFFTKIFLTRWLTPTDFGVVAIGIALLSFINLFHDLGLSAALMQRQKDIQESFNNVFSFILLIGIIFAAFLFLSAHFLANFFNDAHLLTVILLMASTIPFGAIIIPSSVYLSKNLLFFKRFIAETIPPLIASIVSITLALNGWGYKSIAIGYITGPLTYAAILWYVTPWKPRLSFNKTLLKQLLHYGIFVFIANLAALAIAQGDNLVVGKMLTTTALGYYAIAYTLATLPTVNLAHILSKVFLPLFAKLQDQQATLTKSFLKSMRVMSNIALPIPAGTILITPFIFSIMGEKWLPAYNALIILSFLALFKSLSVIPSFFLQGIGHSKKDMQIACRTTVLVVLFIIPSTYFGGIEGTSIAMTITYGYALIDYLRQSSKVILIPLRALFASFLPSIIATFFMIISGAFIRTFLITRHNFINAIFTIASCAIVYAIVSLKTNKDLFAELKKFLNTPEKVNT
ncbi:lipopolysaccharide biosynthesis protein [Candidatus Woesearchaeota archaeon]|nr:lipopolysaccharide biosynthesis protein [Candidatus Woesearchaeota archaeon]